MAKPKPSLTDLTLQKGVTSPPSPSAQAAASEKEEKRIGQTLRLGAGAHKQLKRLAVDVEKPMHDLLLEAVNDLFTKYGKPPIA
ncbi:ribbon-helix-helix domain-containing protein [Almyronema epifaneia]|uniref:Ribbon-helix-helix domain-containing protein n=1 Tax=Almyronema epifaneia S1 TaxID=2991925 RepID=A0ABW6IJN4_9CYAN